jgi:uncharacterized protein
MGSPRGAGGGNRGGASRSRARRAGSSGERRVVDPTPRCVVITLAHGDAVADPALLRTVAQHSAAPSVTLAPGVLLPAVVGAYAIAAIAGPLVEGDVVTF